MASNRCDASAKSSTALTVLAHDTVSGLPLLPSVEPPSRLDTLLNSSPASLLNSLPVSLRFRQFTSTWVTVSCALFAADVLRLELVGNTGLHLTIVDLPGLISVVEYEEDVKVVANLVDSYLQHSRTIILAVIPATGDVDTQGIIQRARCFDEDGLRTVGIITKLDFINAGTEARITRLANNCNRTNLTLGPFVLKNPSPTELKAGMTTEERRRMELAYFSTEPWKKQGLDLLSVRVDKSRWFLEEIWDRHIERELPKVREDIRRLLREKNEELDELGTERKSPTY